MPNRGLKVVLSALVFCLVLSALVPVAIAAGGDTIAFQGFRRAGGTEMSVFTMAADGGNVTRLGVGEEPSISRDGKKIVFVKAAGENRRDQEVFVMDSDGTNVHQLSDDKSFDRQPTISPDGKEVAYVSEGKGQKPEGAQIFLMTISGSDPVQLTRNLPEGGVNTEPGFSPNGKRIVFIHSGRPGGAEIEAMNIDGSGRIVLGRGDAFDAPSHPSYAPDGRRIAFQANAKKGGQTNVYTFNPVNGSDLDKINKGDAEAFEPAYSPDGRSIAFRRGINLFSMTLEGSEVEQLTDLNPADGANTQPSWSW